MIRNLSSRALEEKKASNKPAAGLSGTGGPHSIPRSDVFNHTAVLSTSSSGSQAVFSGLLEEEDDLLPVVLGSLPPPQTLDKVINEAAARRAGSAAAHLTQSDAATVGAAEPSSVARLDGLQIEKAAEGAAVLENEIGKVLEALLMHAANAEEPAGAGSYAAHHMTEKLSSYNGQSASTDIHVLTAEYQQAEQSWLTEQPASDVQDTAPGTANSTEEECMLIDDIIDHLREEAIPNANV